MQGISEATSYASVGRGAKPAKRSGPRAAVRDFVTPLRFGRVTRASRGSSIYRGSYPTLPHFRFLKSLKLKTVLSLTPEPPSADLVDFASLFNITIVHIQIVRTDRTRSIQRLLSQALNVLIDPANLPVYMHCLDGRRISSLAVLLLRRLQGWCLESAVAEYWSYQPPILPPVSDVAHTDRDLTKAFYESPEDLRIPLETPSWLWEGSRSSLAHAGMKSKFVKSTKEKHADISHSHSGIAGVVSGIADGIAGHSLASGIAGDVSPGMLMEAHYGVYRPLLEAKTRYSFSGMGMRDGSSMQSIRLAMTSREHARSISRGKFVNKPNVLLSLSEDKTIIALDLAIPKQSQDKKTILLKRVGRCTQEI